MKNSFTEKMKSMMIAAISAAVMLTSAASCGSDDPAPTPDPGTQTVAVTGVTVTPTTLSLVKGRSQTLTATVAPDNATNKTVAWSSSATAIATVNATTGEVTAVAAGSATITVTTADGNRTNTCLVTVTNPEYDVYFGGTITVGAITTACYWKNDEVTPVILSRANVLIGTLLEVVAVGNDVHALTVEMTQEGIYSVYWRNGQASQIGAVNTMTSHMKVVNGDVHIVGYTAIGGQNIAKYWKNGTDQNINGTGMMAMDISIYNNKYYICGYDGTNGLIWKNSPTSVQTNYAGAQGETVNSTTINSIYAYGDDTYLYGGHAQVNNNRRAFMSSGFTTDAASASVTAVIRYESINTGVGHYKSAATNKMVSFLNAGSITRGIATDNAYAYCLFVHPADGNMYIGGSENDVAAYWINQTKVTIPGAGTGSSLNSIYIAERP